MKNLKLDISSVPEELIPLIPGFLERRRKDVDELMYFLKQEDLAAIKYIGHRLKGSGTGYGFQAISNLGATIEAGAESGDFLQVSKSIEELHILTENLRTAFASVS